MKWPRTNRQQHELESKRNEFSTGVIHAESPIPSPREERAGRGLGRGIDAALERAYTRLACRRAGITDVAEFKKKAGGQPDMKL
jgi:hypothetical protein